MPLGQAQLPGPWPGEGRHLLARPSPRRVRTPVEDGRRAGSALLGKRRPVRGLPVRGRRETAQIELASQLTLFLPIFMTAPVFGFICGLLLGSRLR